MPSDDLRLWFADYLEASNRHDLSTVRTLIAPGVRRAHLPTGADTWIADLDELFGGFPDFRWKRITVLVEGDRLAAQLRAGGTHRGVFRGIPGTGRHLNVAEFGMYRIANGQIIEYSGTPGNAELVERLS